MFTLNSLVVYPSQGVGIIERIDHKNVGAVDCEFYIVRIRANNITLMVPVTNAHNVGLRLLSDKNEARKIYDLIREPSEQQIFTGQNWNRRYREYTLRLKSPELLTVAGVLHELLIIGRCKELSFGERRILDQAMDLVCGELSEVLNLDFESIKGELLTLFARPLETADTDPNKKMLKADA